MRTLTDAEFLRLLDYVVSKRGTYSGGAASKVRLEQILKAARSKWTIGDRLGRPGLVERVPAGVQDSVEGIIATSELAGVVLARAWSHVHGLEPNDSAAYSDAVRAVEIVAIAAVEPDDASATLGSVIRRMRTEGDWALPLREHQHAPSPELVIANLRTLWHGHRDRHGSADYTDVTHEEARAAVVLAATLVDWFDSGAIARRPVELANPQA
jgi:hypothetical protein